MKWSSETSEYSPCAKSAPKTYTDTLRLHIQQTFAIANGPEGQRIKEDEEAFTDPDNIRVVLTGERKTF